MSVITGYDVETVDERPKNLECPICNKILRETLQTNRGARACKACYKKASEGLNRVCPIDKEPEPITFKDKHADRQVKKLLVYCSNKVAGCEWKGPLEKLENHKEGCEFVGAVAANVTPVAIIANGQCPWKCGEMVTPDTLFEHSERCGRLTSPNCCLLEALGCTCDGKQPIDRHFGPGFVNHWKLLVLQVVKNSLTGNTAGALGSEHDNESLAKLTENLSTESTKNLLLNNEVDNLKVQLNNANQKIASLQNDVKSIRDTFQALVRELNHVKQLSTPLEDRLGKLEEKARSSSAGANNTATVNKAIEESKNKLVTFEDKFNNLQTSFSELDLRQQLLENTSLGGRFLWKVDRFKHRMKQAISGQITALHSAPCFTKKFGYKFCARLYLNGDGIGKNTHVSLFFVLMRSEYDALLYWPFQEKVSFKLINHTNENDSVKESFTPDARSPSFKQPQREMNLAAGCPMFITREKLESGNFVLDDSIYIETIVGNN